MLTIQSYVDDILMRGAHAADLAARIQRLATGCATEADTHFDPSKSAHEKVQRRPPPQHTAVKEVAAMGWTEGPSRSIDFGAK